MAYTEFRKSCGDFEVVIPAVDFSKLPNNHTQLQQLVQALLDYKTGFVCIRIKHRASCALSIAAAAAECISEAVPDHIGGTVDSSFAVGWNKKELNYHTPFFGSLTIAGQVLRQEWCEHMAREIEREYGLEPNPYILEEH